MERSTASMERATEAVERPTASVDALPDACILQVKRHRVPQWNINVLDSRRRCREKANDFPWCPRSSDMQQKSVEPWYCFSCLTRSLERSLGKACSVLLPCFKNNISVLRRQSRQCQDFLHHGLHCKNHVRNLWGEWGEQVLSKKSGNHLPDLFFDAAVLQESL